MDSGKGNMTLAEFEGHTAPPSGEPKWKTSRMWTFTKGGKRIPLHKTCLLKYYKGSSKDSRDKLKPRRGRTVHRNEFRICTKCNKRRRFLRNSKEECRAYHRASLSGNWTCADFPNQKLSCEDVEERDPEMMLRGCPVRPLCKGCRFCVCFGCKMCCFQDCGCRSCVDFIVNAGYENSDEEDQISDEEN